jgi:hypothetical protein
MLLPAQQADNIPTVDVLLTTVGIAATIWLIAQGIQAIFSEPRDTYKYVYIQDGRIRHGGVTNDLDRREQEHRAGWRGGTIHQVGRRVTRRSALAWERQYGF